jgi:mannose-1-phosphate guanylyltransferase
MIVVIIAGGSGTRLWPLSTPEFPKHLLKVDGDELSLLQRTFERTKKITDRIYVATEAGHLGFVKEQLPDLSEGAFIVEPARRGTANCIALSLAVIQRQRKNDEAIAFVHADHYIRDLDGFAHTFSLAGKIATAQKKIVLVGIEPTGPATGFGYIEKGEVLDGQSVASKVRSFKEKPDYKTAKEYIKSGHYLWNAGIFVATLQTFVDSMKKYAPELAANYEKLSSKSIGDYKDTYLKFESDAIDYALMEKVPDLLVIPATFDWMDLGSFNDLARATHGDEIGNCLKGEKVALEDVKNSFIYNSETKPMAVIGLDNVVVINTPEGLLVARKDLSQKVGEVSKRLNGDKK